MHDALSLGENNHAIYAGIPRSKSVCTIDFAKNKHAIYVYVYLVLKACARRTLASLLLKQARYTCTYTSF